MTPPLLVSYTSQPDWPVPAGHDKDATRPLRIAILDSCFNPPSLAHYAMGTHDAPLDRAYDARLLLLSSKNVDKVHQDGDTSFDERTEMMQIEAERMGKEDRQGCGNVAVASLAAATFAEKTPIILDYLRQTHPAYQFTLTFYIGFDTVVRLFAKRYYQDSDEEMDKILQQFFVSDGCEVVCARRPVENVAQQDVAGQEEAELVSRPLVKRYLDMKKLRLEDIQGTEGVSSTKIRQTIKADPPEEARKQLAGLASQGVIDYCLSRWLYSDAK